MRSPVGVLFVFWMATAMLHGQSADSVLARMDSASPSFRGVSAHLTRLIHTAVINDDSRETGSFSLLRMKSREPRVLIRIEKPDQRIVSLSERKAEIYNPKAAVVQEFDLGKQKGLVDQFLLLGFGVSGKDIRKSYAVQYLGEATVAGQKCSRLDLTPKSGQVKEHFSHIELCIADPGAYPVRQKLFEPSGNFTDITYSDVKLNPSLRPDDLALNLPKNVKREYPQR
ncbi:MAG: outer membrane lipoprotein carrier protein LolA [Bryobacterales bacterium]|nr:outer membrane lipoprotein carrier protein LolA [Bryobacterales bacterium]